MSARLPGLDALRGIACLAIVIAHAGGHIGFDIGILGSGVPLFFVLSGYLITGILMDAKGRPDFFRTFYYRRALRIWPVYYAALLVFFVLLRPLLMGYDGYVDLSARQVWFWLHGANWLASIHGRPPFYPMNHCWSLAVEEQFYLVWPLIVWACSRRALIAVAAALVVAAPLARWWMLAQGYDVAAEWSTPACMDMLAVGALVRLLPSKVTPAILAGLAACGAAFLTWQPAGMLMNVLSRTALAAWFAWAVVLAAETPWKPWAPLRWVGLRSYAIYVYHFPVQFFVWLVWTSRGPVLVDQVAFLLLTTAATFVLAEASWRYLEAPCLAMRDRRAKPVAVLA